MQLTYVISYVFFRHLLYLNTLATYAALYLYVGKKISMAY